MNVSVLTYHSINISGNEYHNNDHIALESDLKLFAKLNIKIISAYDLVNWIYGNTQIDETQDYVALTFDDGSELDYSDWQHPTCGFQNSFYTLLKNHHDDTGQFVHATSFVIASPDARKILETTCLGGYKMWGDKWWQAAEDSQILSIENHSWDHLHPTIDVVKQSNNLKGDFSAVDNFQDAQNQIQASCDYINSKLVGINKHSTLFAYPYGDYNTYMTEEYFPKQQNEIKAAFTCQPKKVTNNTNVWKIPRYVCGADWHSTDELENILTT